MNYLIEILINIIDKIYHQKKIFAQLKKLNISSVIDVGAHKGEFLSYLLTNQANRWIALSVALDKCQYLNQNSFLS